VPIGIYSTSYQWRVITGGHSPAVDANWVATGQATLKRARGYCTATGFTGAPVWLVQYVVGYDHDYAC
jgi:uroporphyrinogen-III decarboxylase